VEAFPHLLPGPYIRLERHIAESGKSNPAALDVKDGIARLQVFDCFGGSLMRRKCELALSCGWNGKNCGVRCSEPAPFARWTPEKETVDRVMRSQKKIMNKGRRAWSASAFHSFTNPDRRLSRRIANSANLGVGRKLPAQCHSKRRKQA
jgi:hypothetical protein